MNHQNSIPKFNYKELANLNFGELEGEDDKEILSKSLIITNSIQQLLRKKFNYVLSPKGAGKSAIFNAFQNKIFPSNLVDFNVKNFIGINDSFVFDDEYLNPKRFKHNLEDKNYTFAWGLYLISKLINDIVHNHYDKPHFSEFQDKIRRIENFKEEFDLSNIWDKIERLNVQCDFIVSGQKFTIAPKISKKNNRKNLSLNEVYNSINEFYEKNGIETVVLIDRIDNFVGHEEYLIQKKYIQGLVNAIEEIRRQSNVQPLLFLRTDLFQTLDITFEFDKAKARTLYLKWTKQEIIKFIALRLYSNKYIQLNYEHLFSLLLHSEVDVKKHWLKHFIHKLIQRKRNVEPIESLNVGSKIFDNFIYTFFPLTIHSDDKASQIDFFEWLHSHFENHHNYINPRSIIYFFNELCLEQFNLYENNISLQISEYYCVPKFNKQYYLNVFTQEAIIKSYEDICNKELLGIRVLLDTSTHQNMFDKLNEVSCKTGIFTYGGVNYKKYGLDKKEYERLLKHLDILGFCQEIGSRRYSVPLLYQIKLIKE